jgi:hypothetical protein
VRYSDFDMCATYTDHVRTLIWGYIFGPFLAFLPARWRATWFANRHFPWRGATIVSGMLQFLMVPLIVILLRQYQYFFLVGYASHPMTWFVFYCTLEGAGRAIAAGISGETAGTMLLVAPDRMYLFIQRKLGPPPPPLVSDLVTQDDLRTDWQLKIESCRPKHDWNVGRLLRYEDRYYRIESCSQEGGARPFVFLFSAVAAGVPSRSVILYSLDSFAPGRSALSPQSP